MIPAHLKGKGSQGRLKGGLNDLCSIFIGGVGNWVSGKKHHIQGTKEGVYS